MRGSRNLGSRGLASANGPYRFVSNHYLRKLLLGERCQRAIKLRLEHLIRLAPLAFSQDFADTGHWREARLQGRDDFLVSGGIRLAEKLPAFAVRDKHPA